MRPVVWISAILSGAATAAILTVTRKPREAPPAAPKQYGEAKVSVPLPSGWRRISKAEMSALPELKSQAAAVRNMPGFTSVPYGTLYPFTASDGRVYAAWVDQHYNEPEGPKQPWGYHHGVTALARVGEA